MSLEEIKKRWAYQNLVTYQGMNEGTAAQLDEDIRKLIMVAEAAKVYVHIAEREKWEALENLKKALAELEGS